MEMNVSQGKEIVKEKKKLQKATIEEFSQRRPAGNL
jgi:hypothetical protein